MKTKFKEGDTIYFKMKNTSGIEEVLGGTIYIVDRLGTFFNPNEPHYDVMVNNVLYKHIPESWVWGEEDNV